MFKRILVMATLVCALPAMANAWSLNTWAKSGGGNIVVGSGAAQTSAQGSVFASYTTTNTVAVAVTAAPGYTISKVTQNGVVTTGPVSPFNTTVAGPTAQSVFATFKANTVAVTATCGAGGSVSPRSLSNIYYGQKALAAIKFVFTPKAGFAIGTISNIPTGFGWTSVTGTNGAVTVTIPKNYVFNSAIALGASPTSTSPVANAGAPQTVLPNTLVTLHGSVTGTSAFTNWSSTNFPRVALTSSTTLTPTFTPSTPGTYTFKLAVGAASSATTSVTVTSSLAAAMRNACADCHAGNGVGIGVFAAWSSNAHKSTASLCYTCHVGANTGGHPGTVSASTCNPCHNNGAVLPVGDPHATTGGAALGCIDCHSSGIAALPGLVNDNTGVRAIIGEFSKRSHHITGATPTNAQCAVCHLEGKAVAGAIVVDAKFHMKDAKIYLRDVDNAAGVFAWDGSNHTVMDNFCFACHDANGASDLTTLQGLIPAATASNPFADTLTNGYDQVARAGVVDVKTAFTTTNASHHAVSGQRYKYRFSTLLNAQAWAARTGNPVPAASDIAEGHTDLDGAAIDWTGLTYDPAGPEEGGEATLYEGGKFVATYIPLGASLSVADNSTLHCGDCHTVGQWKAGSSTNADGSATSVAIGAHGSANEYLLRNSLGTDAIHNGLTYVCFNCHAASQEASTRALWDELVAEGHILPSTASGITTYTNTNGLNPVVVPVNKPFTLIPSWKAGWGALHPTVIAGSLHGYNTAHAVSAFHAQCQADSADNLTSVPNRGFRNFSSNRLQRSWSPQAVKIYDYLPAAGATAAAPLGGSNAASGNITGIACTNCHNSALRSGFGGIHGGDNTYTDGLGRVQKSYRFMPGMGNYRYAPPGGWDGKDVSDPTLLTATNPLQENGPANGSGSLGFPGASGKPVGGCYTNGGASQAGDLNQSGGVTYGTCNHHGTSTAQPVGPTSVGVDKITVTGNTARFRTTYGGGTTSSPTTYEPTVREATAGGTLVTRPLKY